MGMTYKLSALPSDITVEKLKASAAALPAWDDSKPLEGAEAEAYFNNLNAFWDGLYEKMLPLTDDMVFDRECLGSWMQLKYEDYVFPNDNGLFIVNKEHISRAIDTLETLVGKVASMPFDRVAQNEEVYNKRAWNSEKNCWDNEYHGSPNNIAIFMEVEKVLLRAYHFTFPWENPEWQTAGRVPQMLATLRRVQDFMRDCPNRVIVGEYY